MRKSLQGKLILSYLAVALITVLVVSTLVWLNSGQSLMGLVVEQQTAMLTESAQTYYTTNGNLDGFFDYYLLVSRPSPAPDQPTNAGKPPRTRDMRGVKGMIDLANRAIIPTLGYDVGQIVPAEMIRQTIPVKINGQTVAWILPDTGMQFSLSPEEQLYLQRTTLAIGLAALAGVLAAVVIGILLSGGIIKPVRRLTRASQALARGDLQQQVPVSSQDELGQLTATFNQMSTDLAQADQQRKRMTADITHDLSTPLQVIAGYLEMLEEGEVVLTPQRIEIIKTEIGHLRRLVGDLGTLTQVEGNALEIQPQPEQPAELMSKVFRAYQPIAARQGVELALDIPEAAPEITIDEGRMFQVLKNLVDNALQHTPPGGKINLRVVPSDPIQLQVSDTGSGIDAEDLPYVFERFYRADKARGVNTANMGLGLAICKALVTAQQGTIAAESAGKGQGTTMTITFKPAAGV